MPRQAKRVDPTVLAATNDTHGTVGHCRPSRWRDRSASLIRHAEVGTALPVRNLAASVSLPAPFCLLVAPVCFLPLASARPGSARFTAIALTSVARPADHEDDVTLGPEATPGTKRHLYLGNLCHIGDTSPIRRQDTADPRDDDR